MLCDYFLFNCILSIILHAPYCYPQDNKKLRLRKVHNSQGHRQIVEIQCARVCFWCFPFLFPATLLSYRYGESRDVADMGQCEVWSVWCMGRKGKMTCFLNSITRHTKKMVLPRILKSKVNNASEIGEHFLALCSLEDFFSG